MSSETAKPASGHPIDPSHLFDRVLCGVDGSDESTEAVAQANALAPAEAQFTVFGIVDTLHTVGGVAPYGSAYSHLSGGDRGAGRKGGTVPERPRATADRRRRARDFDDEGAPREGRRNTRRRRSATREPGIGALSSAASPRILPMLHGLRCSWHASSRRPRLKFPRTIVIGYDGSAAAGERWVWERKSARGSDDRSACSLSAMGRFGVRSRQLRRPR